MQTETDPRRRGRWTLVALGVLFVGPLALAWTLYMGGYWKPGAGANNGVLLQPVVTLPRTPQPLAAGGSTEGGYLLGKWSLVHLVDSDCAAACTEALVTTRQVRLALGREIERIQRIAYVAGAALAPDPTKHPDLIAVRLRDAAGDEIAAGLRSHGGGKRYYVVDPLGNLILGYDLDAPPADLRDDLKKLLRLSRIG